MIASNVFLPKDPAQSLFVITHELLHRLIQQRKILVQGDDDGLDEYVEGLNSALRDEIAFSKT